MAALVKAVVARFGRIDILVNNVAISDNKTILEITEEDWDRVMTVTLKSQFLMTKHVAQQMVAQGSGGRIVNVGSTSGWQGRAARDRLFGRQGGDRELHPRAGGAARARTRSASTRSCRTRSARRSAGTSSIRPARCENMLKRAGQPEEAAKAILFLASDDFLVHHRREFVRRRRHHGDGPDGKLTLA